MKYAKEFEMANMVGMCVKADSQRDAEKILELSLIVKELENKIEELENKIEELEIEIESANDYIIELQDDIRNFEEDADEWWA